ncbi:hypothetical protein K435DRAFT_970456, partial [Dendrothele bispora CBS 962.96]
MIGTAVEFTQMRGEDIFNENLLRWLSSSAVLTFCTNGYCAALIAWRIRQFQKDTPEGTKGRLYKATAIFIESAALYMSWALAYLISYETQTNLQTAIVDLGPACAGIACTMISIRVGMGRDKVYLATDSLVNVQHAMTHTETLSLPQFSPNRNVFTTSSSSSSSESDSGISIDPEIIDASSGTASDGIIYPKKEESHNVSAIPLSGSELWRADSVSVKDVVMPEEPLICAEDNFRLEKFSEELPQWRYLTTERVATYHSHLTAVRRIVDDNTKLGVDLHREPGKVQDHIALVLEDDIDMEVDIKARMAELMPLLPYDWDMLFLGFCWSKETEHAEIIGEYSRPIKNHLHPSFQPRCLHAYALSPAGAVRLLKHLRHPPYAYGRSVDLATEWLVWEKRLKSFTVVPPVIIQRKVTKTDITLVGGAHWPESLENGVLGTTGDEI